MKISQEYKRVNKKKGIVKCLECGKLSYYMGGYKMKSGMFNHMFVHEMVGSEMKDVCNHKSTEKSRPF